MAAYDIQYCCFYFCLLAVPRTATLELVARIPEDDENEANGKKEDADDTADEDEIGDKKAKNTGDGHLLR